jgi:negative regulator of sigma E activity
MDERNLNTNMSPGWVPVGFSQNKEKPAIFSNGPKKFVLHVENSNVSLTKPIYWKKGNNLVYLHPTTDGKIITVYGNIRPAEAQKIVFSLKR